MIVSHKHKYIFLKTHKTGGTSLQIALSKSCGDKDIISRIHKDDMKELKKSGGKDEQNSIVPTVKFNWQDRFQYYIRRREQIYSEHIPSSYLQRWLDVPIWNSYYKFAFERNPFDKVLSYYFWRTRNIDISLDDYLDSEELGALSDFHLYTNDNEIIIDKVFLYEDLENAIQELESRFEIQIEMSKIKAKASYRPSRNKKEEFLSDNQKRRIAKAFENEILIFYPELKIWL